MRDGGEINPPIVDALARRGDLRENRAARSAQAALSRRLDRVSEARATRHRSIDARGRLWIALTVLLSTTAPPTASAQRDLPVSEHRRELIGKQFDARVLRVGDGDTFDVQLPRDDRRLRIRLQGVDAPEIDEVFGREATSYLRKLLVGRTVRVDGRDMDRYGRLVARVTVDGQDTSTVMIRAGLACQAYARDPALAQVESQARAARAGFWAASRKPRCVGR
jgi:endonuclease YncB( thermonuclease family)